MSFNKEGVEHWKQLGNYKMGCGGLYFDILTRYQYKEILAPLNLKNKTVVNLGAGYRAPKEEHRRKGLRYPKESRLEDELAEAGANSIVVDISLDPLTQCSKQGERVIQASAFIAIK